MSRSTGIAAALIRRWPTWFAIALTALTAGGDSGDASKGLAQTLLLLQLPYLVVAVSWRRQAAWGVAGVGIAALLGLGLQDRVDPAVVLLAAALALVLWGAARGQLRRPDVFMLETAGMLGFGALALAALFVDQQLGRYLLAAGWLGHAAWDFAHYRADRVVSRSYAEWCAVLDLIIGVGILFMP